MKLRLRLTLLVKKTGAKFKLWICVALFVLTAHNPLYAKEKEPSSEELGKAIGIIETLYPKSGQKWEKYLEAVKAKDRAKTNDAIQSLKKSGVDPEYTQALEQFAQLSNVFDQIAFEVGRLKGQGEATLLIMARDIFGPKK